MELKHPDLEGVTSEERIIDKIADWILNESSNLSVDEAIAPMTGELFVPYKYDYSDILRTWLKVHSKAQNENDNEALILVEKVIETTVTQEAESGTLLMDSH